MQIKVCGLKYAPNIAEIIKLNIDFAGFIFYEKSPRYALPEFEECGELKCKPKKTGVFVNESTENILKTIKKYHLDAIQLHGNESVEQITELRPHIPIILKAFQIQQASDFDALKDFVGLADYFLFDSASPNYGGSGKKFNWGILKNYRLQVPFLLSGGICEHDASEILAIRHPQFAGIDLNSCFEISPGLKDVHLLKKFMQNIKQHDTK